MKRFSSLLLTSLLLVACMTASEAMSQDLVTAEIGLNKDIFYVGDYFYLWLNVANGGPEVHVDLWVKITTPDGTQLYGPEFGALPHPFLPNFGLPSGWASGWIFYAWYKVPTLFLPVAEPGEHVISFWLNEAGTDNRVTPESSMSFTVVPCTVTSWVNDNYIYGLSVTTGNIWAGLTDGVQIVPFDNSRRVTYLTENGVRSSFARLFEGPGGWVTAGGDSVGISVRELVGWRTLLNEAGAAEYVYGVKALATDAAGFTWVIHEWPGFFETSMNLLRMSPDGEAEDVSYLIAGETQTVCLTDTGDACVAATDGLHVFNGDTFDFQGIAELGASAKVLHAFGDPNGNVWLAAVVDNANVLLKHDLDAAQTTAYDEATPGLLPPLVSDMTSDSLGNVWFAVASGLVKYDGAGFTSYPTAFQPTAIDVGPDDGVYCGSEGAGIHKLKDGLWSDYTDLSPEIREAEYSFAVGHGAGEAIIAGPTTLQPLQGYEAFDGVSWAAIGDDGSLPITVTGVFEGQNVWAWGASEVYVKLGDTWLNTTGESVSEHGEIQGVVENDGGDAYLLTSQMLFEFDGTTWNALDTPEPQSLEGYVGIFADHNGQIYLYDNLLGLELRDAEGNWSRIDDSNILPAPPEVVGLADSNIMHACGHHPQYGEYMIELDGPFQTMHWFEEHNQPASEVSAIAYDMAGRVWMLGRALDNSAKAVIFDPSDTSWKGFDEDSGFLPCTPNKNMAIRNSMADRSFSRYGTLWWAGVGGPKRVNLAPHSAILIDRDLLGVGEHLTVDLYFSNFAGSLSVDWYAVIDDTKGNRIYWAPNWETGATTWTSTPTPALQNLRVPTDTAFILRFGTIEIPWGVGTDHYTWRSGFKRAGESEWLGVGLQGSDEFCVIVPME